MKFNFFAIVAMAFIVSCGTQEKQTVKSDGLDNVKNTENVINSDNKNIKQITVAKTSVTKNVSKQEFSELISTGKGIIVDVRTPQEFDSGNIDGAVNIDIYNSQFKTNISKLDVNMPVYVYCRSGGRSAKAMAEMKKLGFKEVYNLKGGYSGWVSE